MFAAKKIKQPKVIIIDAGGVLHLDAEPYLPNQTAFAALTRFTPAELKKVNDDYRQRDVLTGKRSFREVLEKVRKHVLAKNPLGCDLQLRSSKPADNDDSEKLIKNDLYLYQENNEIFYKTKSDKGIITATISHDFAYFDTLLTILKKENPHKEKIDDIIKKEVIRIALEKGDTHPLNVDDLLEAYKEGITLFPGVREMMRDLYKAGYQVVICTTNSDEGIANTKRLLGEKGLCPPIYGSAELGLLKHDPTIYLKICEAEKVRPENCWFIDDRKHNLEAAQSLGISTIKFNPPMTLPYAAKRVNACREALLKEGILRKNDVAFPPNFNRGKYPSQHGKRKNHAVFFKSGVYIILDKPDEDGNLNKRRIYQSRLAKLIVEQGRKYWAPAYHVINRLFLADFDLKSEPERAQDYPDYFKKIGQVLKKESLIENKENYTIKDLRAALVALFKDDFNLTDVSQFFYNVWLFNYGFGPLEQFVFLTDLLRKNQHVAKDSLLKNESIRLLELFPDMAHSVDEREGAYQVAQPWVTCGPPQERGRQERKNTNPNSKTSGIIKDNDPCAYEFPALSHFAAKNFFSPNLTHPIAKELRLNGGPIIGGSSGTLGRNIYMLAPLVQMGLLTEKELTQYELGFSADLVNRGHHSFEEYAVVKDQVHSPLKPWFDSIRDPIGFYEQLLTTEFANSDIYFQFKEKYGNDFNEPVVSQMRM